MATGRPPIWGNFLAHADEDLLAFGLLIRNGMLRPGFYHGVQAIEKYLKSLVLSILDPTGTEETPSMRRSIATHKLDELAAMCQATFPHYGESSVIHDLKRFTEFDQATRYPWAKQVMGNGFCSVDTPVIGELCKRLRNDLPITLDNYKLGMEVRGYYHGNRLRPDGTWEQYSHEAVAALRSVLPSLSEFVRGWDIDLKSG